MKFYNKMNKERCNEECFICCTEQDIFLELMFFNKKINYPLLQLSNVYNCYCRTSFAHNKCLIGIKKCPTCRALIDKPNLYVTTIFDNYFKYYFDWIKKDAKRINKIKNYIIVYLCFIYLPTLLILEYLINDDMYIIKPKSFESFIFSRIIGIFNIFCISLINLEDYFTKYWLYCPKNEVFLY